jgi:hypothetical protein
MALQLCVSTAVRDANMQGQLLQARADDGVDVYLCLLAAADGLGPAHLCDV